MTKAILLFDGYETLKEQYNKKVLINICLLDEKGKYDTYYSTEYAILKELPQKKEVEYSKNAIPPYSDGDYAVGFNDCLNEILGEEMTDKEFRYIVIEGYTNGIWYVIDTFENDKVIREFKDQRPLAYDYCEKLNRKVVKTI